MHGFANTFEDAITRAAFNREFLAAAGEKDADMTVLAFSWPSLGKVIDFPKPDEFYRQDQKNATNSGIHLMTFFAVLEPLLRAARANGLRTYLLAHSMGNLALESACENWFLHGNGNATLFDAAALAAGDCAFKRFSGEPHLMQVWRGYRILAPKIAIYHSTNDDVLQISNALNGVARLGQRGPKDAANPIEFPPSVYKYVRCKRCAGLCGIPPFVTPVLLAIADCAGADRGGHAQQSAFRKARTAERPTPKTAHAGVAPGAIL